MAHLLKANGQILSIGGNIFGIRDGFRTIYKKYLSVTGPISGAFDPRVNKNAFWVASFGSSRIVVKSTIDFTTITEITGLGSLGDVKFRPDDPSKVYLTKSGEIQIYDADSYTLIYSITDANSPQGIDFDVANNRFFVTNGTNELRIYNLTTNAFIETVLGFSNPKGVIADNLNNNIFVVNQGTGQVLVLNATTLVVTNTINGFETPLFGNLDPNLDKNRIIIGTPGNSKIVAIDRSTKAIKESITIKNAYTGNVIFNPFDYVSKIYVPNYGDGEVLELSTKLG